MTKRARNLLWVAVLLVVTAGTATAAPPGPIRVLVTNDDGVGAPGIDAVVEALIANPNLQVTIIAPAANSSGTGDQRTAPPNTIQVTDAFTASGRPAKAVTGFPADTVLFAVLQEMAGNLPDLVVSGINQGQNLSAEIVPVSGTVGAALWAARLGIPAFAVSEGLVPAPTYTAAAQFTAELVERFRTTKSFRKKMIEKDAPFRGLVLNLNWPTCSSGSVRGLRVVAVGRSNVFTGYSMTGPDTWLPASSNTNVFSSNCASTGSGYTTDVGAFTNGFATISVLNADRSVTGHKLREFKFIERMFP